MAGMRDTPEMLPLAAVFGVNGALYGSLLPRFPQIADQLGASAGEFGLGLVGIGLGGTLGAFVATRAVAVLGGPLRTLRLAGAGLLLSGTAASAAPSLPTFSVSLIALGLCDGLTDPAMNQVAVGLRQRIGSSVMGRMHAAGSAATLGATAVGAGAAAAGVPVAQHVAVAATVLLVIQFLAIRSLRQVETRTKPNGPVDEPAVRDRDRATQRLSVVVSNAWRRRRWWLLVLVAGLAAVMVELPAQEWSGLLLARELSASPFVAGLGALVAVGGVLVGRLPLDHAVDRLGWRRVSVISGVLCVVGTVAGLVLGAATGRAWPLLVGIGLAAVGAAAAVPLLYDRAPYLARQLGLRGDAGPGLISGVFRLGVVVSPLLVGVVAEVAGLFIALGVTAVAGVTVVAVARDLTAAPESARESP